MIFHCARPTRVVRDRALREHRRSSGLIPASVPRAGGRPGGPSADEILRGVADEDNVFALSFQVTYWNRLGWKDPFSHKIFDERQYSYATKFNKEGVYTPQLVVNGHDEFVGSNKSKVQKSIENALSEAAKTEISLTQTKENETLKNLVLKELELAVAKFISPELKEKVKRLEEENIQLQERLSKYTNPQRNKKYYEENKEKIIAHNMEYAKNKKK